MVPGGKKEALLINDLDRAIIWIEGHTGRRDWAKDAKAAAERPEFWAIAYTEGVRYGFRLERMTNHDVDRMTPKPETD